MDHLEFSALSRAREKTMQATAALDLAFQTDREVEQRDTREKEALAFAHLGQLIAKASATGGLESLMASHSDPLVRKASATLLDGDLFDGPVARQLAESFIASIAEFSILDQLTRYGTQIPRNLPNATVASGFTAGTVAESGPKAVVTFAATLR